MKRIDKVKKSVEGCHGYIREGQVYNEIVGDGPHAPVSQDDPDHCDVPGDGHQNDDGVSYGPESHLRGEQRRNSEGKQSRHQKWKNLFHL